jgi:hypothetical protein
LFSKFGFHHLTFALLPVLFLFVYNIHEIAIEDIFIPIIISLAIVIILWIISMYFMGERKSAIIISFLIFLVLIFASIRSLLVYHELTEIQFIGKNIILIPIFSIIAISGTIYIVRKKFSANTTSILNVISITAVSLLIFQAGLFYIENDPVSSEEVQELLGVPIFYANESIQKPDVYFLLLDAYSGDITLKNDFGYDNSEFYEQLEERGFFIQKNSLSNYPNTELSMPSIMNMNYLDFIPKLQGTESRDMRLSQKILEDNKVMQIFHANGYQIYSLDGASGLSGAETEYFCKNNFNINSNMMSVLIYQYIPISSLRAAVSENHWYETVSCALNTMIEFEKEIDQPIYMHTHVYFPHRPFVFDSQGNQVHDSISENRFDNELKDAYLQQIIYANKKTIQIIDSIQQKNHDAVIIILSDHGGRFGVNWKDPSEMDYFRALNNLNALYFPGKESYLPLNIATVNTFRVFFNLYFEADYKILDDRQIWYLPNKPLNQTDVPEIVRTSDLIS